MDYNQYLNDLENAQNDDIYTQLQTVYAENSALIQSFQAIDKQFSTWLNSATFNAKVLSTILPKLETVFAALAGLKFGLEDAQDEEIAPQLRPKLEQLQKRIVSNMTYQETALYQQRLEKLLEQNEVLLQSNAAAAAQAQHLEQERAFAAEKAQQAAQERAEQLRQAQSIAAEKAQQAERERAEKERLLQLAAQDRERQLAYQQERKMRQLQVILDENRTLISFFKGVERQFVNGANKTSFSENAVDELITNYRPLLLDLHNLQSQIVESQSVQIMPSLKLQWETLYKSITLEMTWQQRSVFMNRLKTWILENAKEAEPKMVFIKGGTFMMGEQGVAEPVHQVTVSDFYIGKYPVTQVEWKAIMGNNPSYFKGDDLPVEQVSWHDANEYIARLNQKMGKRYRLATEAEWEYAARGGQSYLYAGSNNLHEVAWFHENSGGKTQPVGIKMPNAYGLYDMSGNIWEWCSDWFGNYSSAVAVNPTGADKGWYRVFRGGSWGNDARSCRVSDRSRYAPTHRSGTLGFRVVCLLQ